MKNTKLLEYINHLDIKESDKFQNMLRATIKAQN